MFRLMGTIAVGLAVFATLLESTTIGADDADSTDALELKASAASLSEIAGRNRRAAKTGPDNLESNPTKEDALIASQLQTYWKSVRGGFQTQLQNSSFRKARSPITSGTTVASSPSTRLPRVPARSQNSIQDCNRVKPWRKSLNREEAAPR